MLFKLQRPLFGGNLLLIYNENKSVMFQYGSAALLKLFKEGEFKIFIEAEIDDSNQLKVNTAKRSKKSF
jgi:hypothetical protein